MRIHPYCISLVFLVLSFSNAFTQTKQNVAAKQSAPTFRTLIKGTGLPHKLANDSLAIIPYEGANIASYEVFVQQAGDLCIVYTNLTTILPGKIDATKYKYLLQRNDHFDLVKIGMSDDNSVYIRVDTYSSILTKSILARIIRQVANVSNIIAGEFQ
jgi:hypothetical protein